MRSTVLPVDHRNSHDLVWYCSEYGPEHDASYLPGNGFSPSPEQPSYLLADDQSIVGAVSLLRSKRYLDSGRGRFAILHSTLGTASAYERLLGAIRPHFKGLQHVYLFMPREKRDTAAILSELGFEVERYSFVLLNRSPKAQVLDLPAGFSLRELDPKDLNAVQAFAASVNESFSELAGHVDLPPDVVRTWFDDPTYVEGGILTLLHMDQTVGTICVTREYEDPNLAEISAFGLRKELRGKGLGRTLLRAGVSAAIEKGFPSVILSVNAENESAISLYRAEGFEVIETVVCYRLACE